MDEKKKAQHWVGSKICWICVITNDTYGYIRREHSIDNKIAYICSLYAFSQLTLNTTYDTELSSYLHIDFISSLCAVPVANESICNFHRVIIGFLHLSFDDKKTKTEGHYRIRNSNKLISVKNVNLKQKKKVPSLPFILRLMYRLMW